MPGTYELNKPHLLPVEETEYSDSGGGSTIGDEDLSNHNLRGPRSDRFRLSHLLSAMSPRRRGNDRAYDYHAAPSEDPLSTGQKSEQLHAGRSWRLSRRLRIIKRIALYLPLAILALFGVLHFVLVILGRKSLFWDVEEYEQYLPDWGKPGHAGEGLDHYPTDATRNILPIPCHSHNDYWRRVPLFDAIHAGCISVEADVWLFKDREDLYVGHDTASLTPERTLASLYVNPLVELLDKLNPTTEFGDTKDHGIFDENPDQTLVLLIDFKTNGPALFPRVREQLEPLRKKGYLSYWDGEKFHSRAVTVVGTGNTPFDLVVENKTYRDIFFDAPLDEMWEDPSDGDGEYLTRREERVQTRGQGKTGTIGASANAFNTSNSYYASTSLDAHVGFPFTGRLSPKQLSTLRGQIKGAKRRGLKSRYWETPSWPTSLRNHIWQMLVEEGADILNVDDLRAASKLDWNVVRHDWINA